MQRPKARGIDGGYVDLDVYQRSMRLMKRVHALVRSFPDYEKYDLADQMRRASKSIAANIAEGYARRAAPKEFARSLRIALGSANEMESHIRTALQLDYVADEDGLQLIEEYVIVGKQLRKLIQYWNSRDGH